MKRRAIVIGLVLLLLLLLAGETTIRGRARRSAIATSAQRSSIRRVNGLGSAFDFAAVVLRTARGVRLEGEVIDEAEQPVAGALVVADPDNVTTTTEADGSFTFEALPIGEHWFSATRGELSAGPLELSLLAPTEPLILHAWRGTTLTVHVLDDRGPIAGANVEYAGVQHATDATGTTRIDGVLAGFQLLDVTAAAHVPGDLRLVVANDPGSSMEATKTLQHGSQLDGSVMAPDGSTVAGATVEVDRVSAITDASGRWHVDGLAAGAYEMSAHTATYATSEPLSIEVDGATAKRDLVIRVATADAVDGVVVDREGAPIANAIVTAWDADTWLSARTATSDARGAFTLRALGMHEWRAYSHRGALASPIVEIQRGASTQVRLVAGYAAIAGTVVDARGAPVAEAQLDSTVDDQGGFTAPGTITDSSGRFDLGGMPAGSYRLTVRRAGVPFSSQTSVTAHPGDDHLVIALDDLGTLRGRVVLNGTPLSTFALGDAPNDPTTVRDANDGRFELRDLAAGVHTVGIVGEHTSRAVLSATIEAGKVTDVGDVVLVPALTIRGHVRTGDGVPVAGAVVHNVYASGSPRKNRPWLQQRLGGVSETTTDATGAYVLEDAALHGMWLQAERPNVGISMLEPMPSTDAVVDLELIAPSGIDGTIRGEHGVVWAEGVDPTLGRHVGDVGRDGAFHIDGLLPGDYHVGADNEPTSATVTVPRDQRANVALE